MLAVLGLVSWQFYYARETQKAARAEQEAALVAPAKAPAEAPVVPAPAAPVAAEAPAADQAAKPVASPDAPASLEKLATASVEYTFTNLGGGLSRALLRKHNAENGSNVVLNEFGSIPIGAITEIAGDGTNAAFTPTVNAASGEITFERTDSRQLHLTKKFVLPKLDALDEKEKLRQEYLVRLDVTLTNRGAEPLPLPGGYFIQTGSAAPIHASDQPIYTGFDYYRNGGNKSVDVNWFSGGGFLMFKKPERPVYTDATDNIHWAGVTNQYFTSIVTPVADEKASSDVLAKQRGNRVWSRRFNVSTDVWTAAGHSPEGQKGERYGVDGALGMPGFTLASGQSVAQSFTIYTGPREYRRLKALGSQEADIMDFGMFGIVSKTLLNSMNTLRAWLGNYGFAIMVLTLVIKSLMWPLQNKATTSMKRMQALQPEMAKLKEKYKDDATKMNTELMKLYKDYNINPLSGCLPMVVQIPIFFGFYNMLGKAVELRNSGFLWWVHDLSQPDTVAHVAGIAINVLPLCMAVTMFWQMAIQPKSGDPVQQRIFMFMPLMFVYFCYNFASALALYWTVQNLFSIAQLYATRNRAAPVLAKAPASVKKKRRD